jgi:hypothetical protein
MKSRKCEDFQTNNPATHFLRVYDDLFDSEPFLNCSNNAQLLYFRILQKYRPTYSKKTKEVVKTNINDISFTEKEGMKYMSKESFRKSIDELIENGFIIVVRSGYEIRKCNIYGLSSMWRNYGTNNFIIKDEHRRASKRT